MKKFEYIKVGREGLLQRWNQESISAKKLNDLGQKGWELITFTFVGGKLAFGYFKRRITEWEFEVGCLTSKNLKSIKYPKTMIIKKAVKLK